jgi:hypothetical protein
MLLLASETFSAHVAFVDGSHVFNNVFVDLYYLQMIVRPGGLIVLDDYWLPGITTASRYSRATWAGADKRCQWCTRTPTRIATARVASEVVFKKLIPF